MQEEIELTIVAPDGYMIDEEKSTCKRVFFKLKEQPKLPTKWEDFKRIGGYFINHDSNIMDYGNYSAFTNNRNVYPTKELAEASLALCQLIRFRDAWNEGWIANWEDITTKFIIEIAYNGINPTTFTHTSFILNFKSKEVRDKFLETFRDLIEVAKPLL